MSNLSKLRRDSAYRMQRLQNSDEVASVFLLSPNDKQLLDRINANDKSALFQFAVKHLCLLTRWIIGNSKRVGFEDLLMESAIPHYMEQIKELAKEYHNKELSEDWTWKFLKPLDLKIKNLQLDAEKKSIQL